MRRTNIFWATLPMTLCFVIVISVNIYVIKVILAQKSSVAPTVTLPPAPSTDQLELEAGGRGQEGRTIQKIQRKDEDPSMFYKVTTRLPEVATPGPQCLPLSSAHLATARTILKVNLQTLVTLSLCLPLNIVNVHIYLTDQTCFSRPHTDLPTLARLVGLSSLVSCICFPVMVRKKLANFN